MLTRIFRLIAALWICSLNQVAQADSTPAAALGCKLVSGYGFEHRYVILYKSADDSPYSKVCVDTLEGATVDSYICISDVHQDADVIRPKSGRRFIIQRDSLRLALSLYLSGVKPTQGTCFAASFDRVCAVYQCEISPNVRGTMLAIEKAKQKELSVNKI